MPTAAQLIDVLEKLEQIVPTEHKYIFMHLRHKMVYTAPELVPLRWTQTFNDLVRITAECNNNNNNSLEWVTEATRIWNECNPPN